MVFSFTSSSSTLVIVVLSITSFCFKCVTILFSTVEGRQFTDNKIGSLNFLSQPGQMKVSFSWKSWLQISTKALFQMKMCAWRNQNSNWSCKGSLKLKVFPDGYANFANSTALSECTCPTDFRQMFSRSLVKRNTLSQFFSKYVS